MKKIGLVVVALRCMYTDAKQLMQCLQDRYVTYWVRSDMAESGFVAEAGVSDHARLWVHLHSFTGQNDPQLAMLSAAHVTGLVCTLTDMHWLLPKIQKSLEGKPFLVTDTGVVNYAAQARADYSGEGMAFRCDYQRIAHGAIVLPEQLHIIRSRRLWPEKQVVVVPDNNSCGHRPENKVEAMARLMASYLDTGATRVVLPAEFLLAQPDPLKAYDDLHTLIARERKVKTA